MGLINQLITVLIVSVSEGRSSLKAGPCLGWARAGRRKGLHKKREPAEALFDH